ncbi:hypothetical protein PAPHI01_1816 [Pancytospora philotis]|nr:hypothetical protein PAPHI01_1816 [Pancytospora philotis]
MHWGFLLTFLLEYVNARQAPPQDSNQVEDSNANTVTKCVKCGEVVITDDKSCVAQNELMAQKQLCQNLECVTKRELQQKAENCAAQANVGCAGSSPCQPANNNNADDGSDQSTLNVNPRQVEATDPIGGDDGQSQ